MRRTLAALAICLLVSHVAAVPVRDGAAPAEQATSSETWLSSWTGRAEKLVNSGIAIKDHLSTMVSSKSDASAEKPVGKKAPICEDLDWRKNSMRLLKEAQAYIAV
ncbi:hypothetical protein T484DRAFT_1778717 [Baffinella frigidus]|nr:hypothetical protein T484DRAFT_1778717 [Cryptophyta sp. CCMP2293]